MDISRFENDRFEAENTLWDPVDIGQEIVDMMKMKCEQRGIYLEFQFEQDLRREVFSDRQRISQVIINLISNAIKFTFTGGIKVLMKERMNLIEVSVVDTGIGISDEDQKKLFEFFSKVEASNSVNRQGMGLGLTISKRIVNFFGGTITC